ncbi:hypothetical protein O7632_08700 [Solwaraspora sp. WMMD406]|uniref:hypothetical protein n=1 Tax=Solwaraspora sp. WMMD406 TaxID=3016095 RepID=UPI002416982F|nr:hypothetical protein [Solwaraspora sp. WMMD406]MDG4764183.1 hypothetical protein [Solwaraspora sp. WMMD406]
MGDQPWRRAGARFQARYGAPAWHLALVVGCFTVAGWVVLRLAGEATAVRMLVWFVAAVIVHDLVLFPVYTAADRMLLTATRASSGAPAPAPASTATGRRPVALDRSVRLSLVNHVRVPALGSALLLLVYLPGVLRLGGDTFTAATGLTQQPYLARWLLISAAMFAASGLWFAARWYRVRSRARPRSTATREIHSAGST